MGNYECALTTGHSTRSQKRIDSPFLSSTTSSTDFKAHPSSPKLTFAGVTIRSESTRMMSKKPLSALAMVIISTRSCHSDSPTLQPHSKLWSKTSSNLFSMFVSLSTLMTSSSIAKTKGNTNNISAKSLKSSANTRCMETWPNANSSRNLSNTWVTSYHPEESPLTQKRWNPSNSGQSLLTSRKCNLSWVYATITDDSSKATPRLQRP